MSNEVDGPGGGVAGEEFFAESVNLVDLDFHTLKIEILRMDFVY